MAPMSAAALSDGSTITVTPPLLLLEDALLPASWLLAPPPELEELEAAWLSVPLHPAHMARSIATRMMGAIFMRIA